MSATTSPMRTDSAQLGVRRCPEAGDPVHQQERQHPEDDPGDPSNHRESLHPSGSRTRGAAPSLSLGAWRRVNRRSRERSTRPDQLNGGPVTDADSRASIVRDAREPGDADRRVVPVRVALARRQSSRCRRATLADAGSGTPRPDRRRLAILPADHRSEGRMIRTSPFHERTSALNETGLWSHWSGHLAAQPLPDVGQVRVLRGPQRRRHLRLVAAVQVPDPRPGRRAVPGRRPRPRHPDVRARATPSTRPGATTAASWSRTASSSGRPPTSSC